MDPMWVSSQRPTRQCLELPLTKYLAQRPLDSPIIWPNQGHCLPRHTGTLLGQVAFGGSDTAQVESQLSPSAFLGQQAL